VRSGLRQLASRKGPTARGRGKTAPRFPRELRSTLRAVLAAGSIGRCTSVPARSCQRTCRRRCDASLNASLARHRLAPTAIASPTIAHRVRLWTADFSCNAWPSDLSTASLNSWSEQICASVHIFWKHPAVRVGPASALLWCVANRQTRLTERKLNANGTITAAIALSATNTSI
jgi:hypothetical protein